MELPRSELKSDSIEQTGQEIERRFIVDPQHLDQLQATASRKLEIVQGYVDSRQGKLRMRQTHDTQTGQRTYDITMKRREPGPYGKLVRQEHQVAVAADDFQNLWPLTEGWRIAKLRHEIPVGSGNTIELDEFTTYPGLVIAEVEFKAVEDALDPELALPSWLGREVTNRKGWGNSKLAKDGPPEDLQPLYVPGLTDGLLTTPH